MRVLILNQTFYPDVAATAQHMWDMARHLKSAGHEVVAIASRNVYGSDEAAFRARETVEGIEVVRVGGTALGKRSTLHRLADFASFYLMAGWQLVRMPAPDVIVSLTSPPMISLLAALVTLMRRAPRGRRIRFVYYVMDVYPEAAVASGMFRRRGLRDRFFGWLTGWTIGRADSVIALGRDMRDLLVGHYGARRCGGKIVIATPWADGDEIRPIPREENRLLAKYGLVDGFNVVYSGNFGIAHDLETIAQAIELTRGEAGLRWVFIGGGKRLEQLKRMSAERGWERVVVLPYQDRELLGQSLGMADVHLISQLPEFTGVVVPSKLFGIMAAGRPSIMVGPAECEVSRILVENSAGVVVGNGDAAGLVAAIARYRADEGLRRETGANARQAFDGEYNARVMCGRVEEAISGTGGMAGSGE